MNRGKFSPFPIHTSKQTNKYSDYIITSDDYKLVEFLVQTLYLLRVQSVFGITSIENGDLKETWGPRGGGCTYIIKYI